MDAPAGSITQLANSCAADIQSALISHPNNDLPHLTSACSALKALGTSEVQLRGGMRDARSPSPGLTSSIEQSLQACAGRAVLLFKQVSRLDAENVKDTNERFWTVLSVFVGAHVKLFNCYTDILSLPTNDHQNERLNSLVTQELIQQAAHAVRLAADAPDIFTLEVSHAALPYRARDNEAEAPPPYQTGASLLLAHNTATVTVRRATQDSQTFVSSHASSGVGGSARSRAWAKITAPAKAMRDHISNGGNVVLPYVDELCAAASAGQAKRVESLVAQGAAVDGISSHHDTALGLAAEFNHIDVATLLLRAGARASFHSPHRLPPVFVAAATGHGEMAQLLLAHGASVTATDSKGQPFLIQLVEEGNHKAMQFLLSHGGNANAKDMIGRTPIVHAVVTNDVPMATMLLAFGADPNARDITGRPILVQAIENHNGALIRFLLDNGADANCKDITGASALSMACQKHTRTSDTVALLLRRGARVDSTTVVGVTVLADALVRHQVGLARLLLEHGADPRATEVTGQPVLITLLQSRKIVLEDKLDLLQRMLERGASVEVQDFVTQETAVEVARKVECKKVVKLLESYANIDAD